MYYPFPIQIEYHWAVLNPEKSDSANVARIKLLARKYEQGELSKEDYARLEILTEKVRKLIPRVTADDYEALKDISHSLEKIQEQRKNRQKKLGLINSEWVLFNMRSHKSYLRCSE